MSSARGLANHSLYMARLVLAGWSRELEQAGASRQAMQAAFAPAVRLHLLDAYGWFLLATIRQTKLPERAPHHSQELPPLGPGIAEPGELDELKSGNFSGNTLVLIGPEGDFSSQEVTIAVNLGFNPIGLGTRILRTETAVLKVLSLQ